jgi:hypothetical protein
MSEIYRWSKDSLILVLVDLIMGVIRLVIVVVIVALIFHGPLTALLVIPMLFSLLVIGRYLRRRILDLTPFSEGQDPNSFFSISVS